MQTIIFSYLKQTIAEFSAEDMEFARQEDGLLVTAGGEMLIQDTPMLHEVANHSTPCTVTITKDGNSVIDQKFRVTFFALEADNLAVLLQEV